MANEALNASGAYTECTASASIASNGFSTAGNTSAIGTAIASVDTYTLVDFQLNVTAGTVSAGDVINLYRRASDGTSQSPIPSSTNKYDYVGSFTINSNSESRYKYSVANPDPNDEYYLENTGAGAITMNMKVRGKTYGTA